MVFINPSKNQRPSRSLLLLLDVREKEKAFEAEQVNRMKQKKEKRRQKLLKLLKELWREKQECKLAALRERCRYAIQHIAQAHRAAILFMKEQEAKNLELEKLAEINDQMAAVRFKNALQKERLRKKEESKPKFLAARRNHAKESAAVQERQLRRLVALNQRSKSTSAGPSFHMSGWFAEQRKTLRCPQLSDFKYTFLHSQLFMDEGHVDSAFSGNKIDAWKAAEIQRQVMERDNLAKMEAKDIMDQRKYLRGQLAGSQLMIERKLKLLDEEMKNESCEKDNKQRDATEEGVVSSSKESLEGVEQGSQVDDMKASFHLDEYNMNRGIDDSDSCTDVGFDLDESSRNSDQNNTLECSDFVSRDADQEVQNEGKLQKKHNVLGDGKQTFSQVSTSRKCGVKIAAPNNRDGLRMHCRDDNDMMNPLSTTEKQSSFHGSMEEGREEDTSCSTALSTGDSNIFLTARNELQEEKTLPLRSSSILAKTRIGCWKFPRIAHAIKKETASLSHEPHHSCTVNSSKMMSMMMKQKHKKKRRTVVCMEQKQSKEPRNIARRRIESTMPRVKPILKSVSAAQQIRKFEDSGKNLCKEEEQGQENRQQFSEQKKIAAVNRPGVKLSSTQNTRQVRFQQLQPSEGNSNGTMKAEKAVEGEQKSQCGNTKSGVGLRKLAKGNRDVLPEAEAATEMDSYKKAKCRKGSWQLGKRTQDVPEQVVKPGQKPERSKRMEHKADMLSGGKEVQQADCCKDVMKDEPRHCDTDTETKSISSASPVQAQPLEGTKNSRGKHAIGSAQGSRCMQPSKVANPKISRASDVTKASRVSKQLSRSFGSSLSSSKMMKGNGEACVISTTGTRVSVPKGNEKMSHDKIPSSSADELQSANREVEAVAMELTKLKDCSLSSSVDSQLVATPGAQARIHNPVQYCPRTPLPSSASSENGHDNGHGYANDRSSGLQGPTDEQVKGSQSASCEESCNDIQEFARKMRGSRAQDVGGNSRREVTAVDEWSSTIPSSLSRSFESSSCISKVTTPRSWMSRTKSQCLARAEAVARCDDPMDSILASLSDEIKKLDARLRSVNVFRGSEGQCGELNPNSHSDDAGQGFGSRNDHPNRVGQGFGSNADHPPNDVGQGCRSEDLHSNAVVDRECGSMKICLDHPNSVGQMESGSKNSGVECAIGAVIRGGGTVEPAVERRQVSDSCSGYESENSLTDLAVNARETLNPKPSKERSTYGIFTFESITPSGGSLVSVDSPSIM